MNVDLLLLIEARNIAVKLQEQLVANNKTWLNRLQIIEEHLESVEGILSQTAKDRDFYVKEYNVLAEKYGQLKAQLT